MIALILWLTLARTQDTCQYDERCGTGQCLTWQHSRFVCEPKQYTVAIYDRTCLDKVELTKESIMEAPIVDGEPDMAQAKISHVQLTKTKGCQFRYEVRNR